MGMSVHLLGVSIDGSGGIPTKSGRLHMLQIYMTTAGYHPAGAASCGRAAGPHLDADRIKTHMSSDLIGMPWQHGKRNGLCLRTQRACQGGVARRAHGGENTMDEIRRATGCQAALPSDLAPKAKGRRLNRCPGRAPFVHFPLNCHRGRFGEAWRPPPARGAIKQSSTFHFWDKTCKVQWVSCRNQWNEMAQYPTTLDVSPDSVALVS